MIEGKQKVKYRLLTWGVILKKKKNAVTKWEKKCHIDIYQRIKRTSETTQTNVNIYQSNDISKLAYKNKKKRNITMSIGLKNNTICKNKQKTDN